MRHDTDPVNSDRDHGVSMETSAPGSASTASSVSEKYTYAAVNAHLREQPTQYEPSPDGRPSQDGQSLEDGLQRMCSGVPSHTSALRNTMTGTSVDAEGNFYPEGGSAAWLVVFGSFSGLFAGLGLVNTIGTFQAYLVNNQLKDYSSGKIGWIFGMYAFLTFFCGVQIGPIFDARGPRLLVLAGSIMIVVQMIAIGFCTQYWHFMLVIGVVGGMGASLIFTPAIAAVGHWFLAKRGMATGIAATGGSVGGVVFPLTLQSLIPKIGFAWATRAVALICLILVAISCLLVKSRLPKKPVSKESMLPDFRILRSPAFALTTAGIFFIEWGLFVPISYISSYALSHGVSEELSYQLLAILNAGSFAGRALPGFFADHLGRFNTLAATVLLGLVSCACLWLPAGNNLPLIIVYSVVFGFASGSGISLTPVCVSSLCTIDRYGTYYSTAYTIVSFGTLTGIPIAGVILSRCNGDYWGLITFTSCSYAAGLICVILAKLVHVGWNRPLAIA